MGYQSQTDRGGERGSAMVISVLVMAILTLLGISFLLMAETENKIAENDRLSSQALYVGEAGARQVKRWFDRPFSAKNLRNPPLAVMDRTLREINEDGDPGTAPNPQDGATWPRYKQGVDLDGDTVDDIFDRPYRGTLQHALLGTEDGPDIRIDENASAAARSFLRDLTEDLIADFPDRDKGVEARISRIDVYEPPYVDIGGTWVRYGMGTVKVITRIYKPQSGGGERVIAERMIKAVLNEMPYPGPTGPLQSCDNLTFNGEFAVHWGAASSLGDTTLPPNHDKLPSSWPRVPSPGPKLDLLWGWDNADTRFADYKAQLEASNEDIEDPWFRYLSGGTITGAGVGTCADPAGDQPCPFVWDHTVPDPLGDGTYPNHDNGGDDGTHSNMFQNQILVTCPDFDYDTWKGIATSGDSDVHYYVWNSGSSFKENGFGAAQTFRDITDDTEGLFFFDTTNGIRPTDTNGDGVYDNLTPAITVQGGTWGVRGFIYANADTFQTKGLGGRPADFRAPGEPFQDIDQDGQFDAGEDWVNFDYPNNIYDPFRVDSADTLQDDGTFAGPVVRNRRGPVITEDAVLWGVLYNSGMFESTGNGRFFGAVLAKSGIGETSPAAGTPDFFWDESLLYDWPPETWDLPRVMITRWETDL